jgi:hypothetical protein
MDQFRRTEPVTETITIERCPLCPKSHTYDLIVQRSLSSYFSAPPPRSYTRLFGCPTVGGTFQLTITVSGYYVDAGSPTLSPPKQPGSPSTAPAR